VPTPPKTSGDAILAAARTLLEERGSDGFTMRDVADAVGVRAPSLYKHVADRAALLSQLEALGFAELGDRIAAAAEQPEPLVAMAVAYRRFARRSPRLYARMLSPDATRGAAARRWRRDAVAPVLDVLLRVVPADRVLSHARTLTAFLHGFVTMEAAGAFRLGGSVDADFHAGLATVLDGILHRPR
jgi:AcrR family transcriptional regulator